jgi:Zn-dependent peptidase ImmA (M78 family)/transcriptional regulator with XRE-family HTH domain
MSKGVESFCSARLTQAREIRGLTGVNLASIVGISSSSLSQYEHDTANPTQDIIDSLAKALNVKPTFFLRQFTPPDNLVFFNRSNSAATKQARRRAEKKYEWLVEIASYFEEVFDFPKLNLPDIEIPSSIAAISSEHIENYATICRLFWSLGDSPIPNVIHTLERGGIIVGRFPLEADTLDGLSEWNGAIRPVTIIASEKKSCVRSRFDAAHEMGHGVMHKNVKNRTSEMHALMERQAHRFAAAFLLPRDSYLRDLARPSLEDFAALKQRWKASISMQIFRCHDLGIIDAETKSRFFANLSRRGWRMHEPGDDQIPVESPRLLRQCVDAMLEANFKTRNQIVEELERPAKDIEEICGLPEGYLGEGHGEIVQLPSFKPASNQNQNTGTGGGIIPFRP